ncbi:protein ALP1-like [Aphis craccivora]|uniref:Protein ALP1-like n=1 Tax=Aphis craccivora TaxID=307492 RepID=A0A6G0YE94_APHCR|nr:protein ALP1-like [Aphis craccivora]
MIPYPRRVLANVTRIYNCKISRARKTIECTFGWYVKKPVNVNFVIKAACVLHNYVRKLEGLSYVSTSLPIPKDCDPNDHIDVRTSTQNMTINETSSTTALGNYFLTARGSVPWKWKYTTSTLFCVCFGCFNKPYTSMKQMKNSLVKWVLLCCISGVVWFPIV